MGGVGGGEKHTFTPRALRCLKWRWKLCQTIGLDYYHRTAVNPCSNLSKSMMGRGSSRHRIVEVDQIQEVSPSLSLLIILFNTSAADWQVENSVTRKWIALHIAEFSRAESRVLVLVFIKHPPTYNLPPWSKNDHCLLQFNADEKENSVDLILMSWKCLLMFYVFYCFTSAM